MKPLTRAKITFWTHTVLRLPYIFWLAFLGWWYSARKNEEGLNLVWCKVEEFRDERHYRTERTYNFYKNGYEIVCRVR